MKEAVEERRRWKKGGEGGIRRGIKWFRGEYFWGIFLESIQEFFYQRTESKNEWNRDGRKLEDRVNSMLEPGNLQETTIRDSPQSTFPTSPLTVWYRESVWFAVRIPSFL